VASVKVDDDSYSHSGLCRGDSNDKNGEEDSVQFFRIQVFIKDNKIDVHTVQYQFYCHQHGNHISPCEQSIHSNEEQGCAYKQDM
jgi:hypothetical protein